MEGHDNSIEASGAKLKEPDTVPDNTDRKKDLGLKVVIQSAAQKEESSAREDSMSSSKISSPELTSSSSPSTKKHVSFSKDLEVNELSKAKGKVKARERSQSPKKHVSFEDENAKKTEKKKSKKKLKKTEKKSKADVPTNEVLMIF